MAQILSYPKFRVVDNNNLPLASGKVYFCETGTTTPQATYSDPALGSANTNTNPVILDARGEAWVFVPNDAVYTVVVKTAADALVWTKDDIKPVSALDSFVIGTDVKLVGASGRLKIEEDTTTNLAGVTLLDIVIGTGGQKIVTCTGSPEGAVTAPVGSMALRVDGGTLNTTLYLKITGTGNTGWSAMTA